MSEILLPEPYVALRAEVQRLIEAGKGRARDAVERERLRTYWEIGKTLHDHLQAQTTVKGYGERVMGQLAHDLEMSQSLVYDILLFY